MRRFVAIAASIALLLTGANCTPQPADSSTPGDLLDTVLTASATPPGDSGSPSDEPTHQAISNLTTFSGNLTGGGNYRFFELGEGIRGDEWLVSANGLMSGPFVVALFDANHNLLMRQYLQYSTSMKHVLREDVGQLYLAIMPPISGSGGTYNLKARFTSGLPVPGPAPQTVWLNFGSGSNVKVHKSDPISFPAFDGAIIGDQYADYTQLLKDVILAEMRADYASYNVTVLSSDHSAKPSGECSIIHFGGAASGLLGLADSVDNYNRSRSEAAIIYVESFAPYWTMKLTPEEMAVMVANVASHELGHLLGLYHTVNHDDLMDSTGSAWDLADNQDFIGGVLEPSVFATGFEDADNLLGHAVGHNPQAAKTAPQKSYKTSAYKAIRLFADEEMLGGCGTCRHLDE